MASIAELLHPLQACHLGVLARCHALSSPALRASDASALLRASSGEDVSPAVIEAIFTNVLAACPELLGGDPVDLDGVLGSSTLVSPAVTACPTCAEQLVLGPARPAKAFCLHRGWMEIRFQTASCATCHASFSNVWQRPPGRAVGCVCVASPADATFFQILACPRSNSKAFIEVRTLWLLRAALLRCKAPFGGFVEMLADLHGAEADREHDCLRFEHHWLMFETLTLLFERHDLVALRSRLAWQLDTQHEQQTFQAFVRQEVLPAMRNMLRTMHFQEHRCDLCDVPVVTFDAKYGLTCKLCNHREGGLVRFENIACNVMFGCQNPPAQSSLYCLEHDIGHTRPDADGPRILRHRDVDGLRSYKLEGKTAWQPRASLPPHTVANYEAMLADRSDRRKKRRGHREAHSSSSRPDPADADDAEQEFYDTDEPTLRPQPDEVNPCGIDKADTQPRRRYGGLLVSTLPCGRVCGATPLAHAESLTQVYALLSCLHNMAPDRLRFVFYDNACALARYSRHAGRAHRTEAAVALSRLTYVLDSFHVANHSACTDPTNPYYLPEVLRANHSELHGVNSQTAEQFFAWVDPFVRSVVGMTPAVFEWFLLLLTHFYNTTICGSLARSAQTRRRVRRNRPSAPVAGEDVERSGDEAPAAVARLSSAPAVPPVITLRRNPHGVGLWGAGKYHWQQNNLDAARRPPCQIVDFATLSETRMTSVAAVEFVPQVGFVLLTPEGKHEVCKLCARALTRAGLLS